MIIKRRRRTTEEDRAKELAKAREKRQKKMIRTKYGQAPKRHARQGIKSCMYFVLAAFVLLLMVSVSFVLKGKVSILVGFAGLFVLASSTIRRKKEFFVRRENWKKKPVISQNS